MVSIKEAIAESFSRAANRYDQAADVQQQAGAELLEQMKTLFGENILPETIADIGCGTGFFAPHLITHFSPKQYIGIDLAQGMLDVAASNYTDLHVATWQCSDAENLHLPDQSIDLIYANFSLQWCEDLPKLMRSLSRVLKPGGYCCFTSLGANSLCELRQAWSKVDELAHVNRFYDKAQWLEAIAPGDFIVTHSYQKTAVAYFDSVVSALRSFKDIGANVVAGEHRHSFTGKHRFALFCNAYESFRKPQGIPVTYIIDGWLLQKKLA